MFQFSVFLTAKPLSHFSLGTLIFLTQFQATSEFVKHIHQLHVWSDRIRLLPGQLIDQLSQELDQALKDYANKIPQPPENIIDFTFQEVPEAMLEQREILLGGNHG